MHDPEPPAEGGHDTIPWSPETDAWPANPASHDALQRKSVGAPQRLRRARNRARLALRALFEHPLLARAATALRALSRRDRKPARPKPPLRTRLLRWTIWLAVTLVCLAAVAAITFLLFGRHYERDLPTTAELKNYNPPQVTRIIARDGAVLAEIFTERRTLVPIAEIPQVMRFAALAAEDARFYEHDGLNYLGMLRALIVNLRSGSSARAGARSRSRS